jgi:cell division GTPase FtsZ
MTAHNADHSPWATNLPDSTCIIGFGDYGGLIVSRAYPEPISGLNRIGIEADPIIPPLPSKKFDHLVLMQMRYYRDLIAMKHSAADTLQTNRDKLLDLFSVPQRVVLVAGLGNSIGVSATQFFVRHLHLAKRPVLLVTMLPWIFSERGRATQEHIRSFKQIEANSAMLKIWPVDLNGNFIVKNKADLSQGKATDVQEFFNETAVEIREQIDSWLG